MVQLEDDEPLDETNLLISQYLLPDTGTKRENMHLAHKPSDETDLLIEAINGMDIGWSADVCKLQRHHASYGSHCDAQKNQLAQKKAEATEGLEVEEKLFGEGKEFEKAWEQARSFQKKYSKPEEIPTEELPDNFDWRNVGGYNFLGDLRDQKACGSCYTFSFVQIMEHKLMIQKGTPMP